MLGPLPVHTRVCCPPLVRQLHLGVKSRISHPLQVTDVSAHLAPGGLPEKEGRLHPCTECGRSFASSALLLQHSKDAHGRERIHVCPACSKAFKRATHLKVRALPVGAPVWLGPR